MTYGTIAPKKRILTISISFSHIIPNPIFRFTHIGICKTGIESIMSSVFCTLPTLTRDIQLINSICRIGQKDTWQRIGGIATFPFCFGVKGIIPISVWIWQCSRHHHSKTIVMSHARSIHVCHISHCTRVVL